MTQLSIVIPVYNNWWMTARALRALDRLRDASTTSFETIVVDNASADETQSSMREFPSVRYERMETNTNFAGACNAGARLATAPLVLFLNNDAYPLGDALTPLARAFDRDEVAIAGGALFFEDGATQGAGFVVLPERALALLLPQSSLHAKRRHAIARRDRRFGSGDGGADGVVLGCRRLRRVLHQRF